MNQLPATISNIKVQKDLIGINANIENDQFFSVLIGNEIGFQIGEKIFLCFKETEVAIAVNFSGKISIRNKFPVTIKSIESGEILSKISLSYKGYNLVSVITTEAVNDLKLKQGDSVLALVKSNEMMVLKNVSNHG